MQQLVLQPRRNIRGSAACARSSSPPSAGASPVVEFCGAGPEVGLWFHDIEYVSCDGDLEWNEEHTARCGEGLIHADLALDRIGGNALGKRPREVDAVLTGCNRPEVQSIASASDEQRALVRDVGAPKNGALEEGVAAWPAVDRVVSPTGECDRQHCHRGQRGETILKLQGPSVVTK